MSRRQVGRTSILLLLLAAATPSCRVNQPRYAAPEFRATYENDKVRPGTHQYAAAVSYLVTQTATNQPFPFGEFPQILVDEGAYVYLCDAGQRSSRLIAELKRPAAFHHGCVPIVVAWEGDAFYLVVEGYAREDSFTRDARQFLLVFPDGSLKVLSSIPKSVTRSQATNMRAPREWRMKFTVQPHNGRIVPTQRPGATGSQ
jgi:hypothetical protein